MVKSDSKDITKLVRGSHGLNGIRGYVIYKGDQYFFMAESDTKKEAANYSKRLQTQTGLKTVIVEIPGKDKYGEKTDYFIYAKQKGV